MRARPLHFVAILSILLPVLPAEARPQSPPQSCLDARRTEAHVPGLAYARLKNGQIVEQGGRGVAKVREPATVTQDTVFEAASLSKPVFAYIVMRAVQDGLIGLDDTIAAGLDSARISDARAYAALTPRIILSHRSALPNWARTFRTGVLHPLKFDGMPGERFRYSGEAYILLQSYLERRSGSTLDALMRRYLGEVMPRSRFSGAPDPKLVVAYGHDAEGDAEAGRPLRIGPEAMAPASLHTSAADYGAFLAHLLRSDLLTRESRATMFTGITPITGEEWGHAIPAAKAGTIRWGLGVGIYSDRGRTLAFHWGDNDEFRSFFAVNLETGDGVVYFTNGLGGLRLIRPVAEPVVGDLQAITGWLGYGGEGAALCPLSAP